MAGIQIFESVREAIRDGWRVLERTEDGYLVEKPFMRGDGRMASGLGRVVCAPQNLSPQSRGFSL